MSNCDKPNCTLKGDHVHAEVESPFKPTEEICEHHFESDFGLEPACTKCGAIQSMTESAKEGPYTVKQKDTGTWYVFGPNHEKQFGTRLTEANIHEAELNNAYAQGRMSREAEIKSLIKEWAGLYCDHDKTQKAYLGAAAEIESLKRAVERIAKPHTTNHIYNKDCDACHRQEIALKALNRT